MGLKLARAKTRFSKAMTWLAVFVAVIAPQTIQPASPALANTATIADGTNNCQIAITSSTVTIDTTSTSISLVGSRCVVKFLTVGSYTITMPGGVAALDYLVVGGGGGGGSGGGGAGGVLQGTNFAVTAGNTYSVSVGAGGAGGRGGANSSATPHSANGDQSVFATVTALGGGAGGEGNRNPDHAGNGASGGGSRYDCTNVVTCIGLGTTGQGTNGAASTHGGYGGGAGGGGAGGAGGNTTLYNIGGKGGDGVVSSITGTSTYYGGGGGGGINSNDGQYCGLNAPGTSDSNKYCNGNTPVTTGGGAGGLGGGGRGSSWGYTGGAQGDISIGGKANGTAGTPNTGGGGGGTDPEDCYAYAGGSGIVVLSYVSPANFRAVTFNSNNGSGSTSTQWVQSGVSTALQTNPYIYTGYVFQGWNTQVDGTGTSYTNLANITTSSALTLYAQWRAGVTHAVTFSANGGTGSQADQIAGQATNLNANQITRSGYTFSGWNTAANGTGYSYLDQSVYSFAQDATLYAQWTLIIVPHSVSFYGNGATSGATSSQTASATQALTLNGFVRTGYNFLGWNTSNSAGSATYLDGQNYSFSADLALYAIWVAQAPNVITYNGNGATSGSMSTETASSSTVLYSNSFARTGYTFLNWNTASNGSGVSYQSSYTYSFAASITLYAIWGQNFTVTYDGNSSTSGSAPSSQSSYVGGAAITLQSNTGNLAKTGYLLSGWNTAANGTGTAYAIGQTNLTLNAGVTLYAQWVGATYVILYTGNGNTSGSVPAIQSYTYGTAGITLRANSGALARTGYTFVGWNTGPDGLGTPYAVSATGATFAQDTVLFAQWNPNQTTVTYQYNGSTGGDSVASAVFSTGGAALVLPTPTKTGYAFGGWYSDSGLTASIGAAGASYSPSTVSSTITVYAKWNANVYLVTYGYNGATGGAGVSSATFTTGGSAIVLPSPTKAGYDFDGWFADNAFATSVGAAGDTFSPNSASTSLVVYAKWLAKTYSVSYIYNGANAGNAASYSIFTTGSSAIALPTPTKAGYGFGGWYSDSGLSSYVGAGGSGYSPNSIATSINLYAKWIANNYSVTYNYNGATGGAGTASASFTSGGSAIILPTPTKTGFDFVGWFAENTFSTSIGSAGDAYSPDSVATTLVAFAKWLAKNYTLTYNYNGATGGNSAATANFSTGGSAIVLPTPTKTGFTFDRWYSDANFTTVLGSAGASISPNSNATSLDAFAKWNIDTYLVNYDYNNADAMVWVASENFSTGDTALTLPAPTRAHFHFDGWYDALTGGNLVGLASAALVPTSNKNLYAHWTQDSLLGLGSSNKIGSLTVSNGLGTQYTATGNSNSVTVDMPSGALPDGTSLDIYLLADSSFAQSLISGTHNFLVNLVVSWLATDGTVPTTATGKPVVVTINDPSIKAGAAVYQVMGGVAQLVGYATQDGTAQVSITDDPELVVTATVPTSPLSATATASNGSATITWSAPQSSGGADIASYLVTASTGQTCTTANLTCTITGLTNGTAVTFTVRALNTIGTGSASTATASVTPSAPQVIVPVTPPVVIPPVTVPVIKDLVLPPLTPGAVSSGQLTGVGLDQLQGLTVGGKPATITPNSSTSATVTLPALAPGVYDLTYTMANGQTTVIAGGLTVPATSTLPVGVATVTQDVAASTVSVSLPVDTSSDPSRVAVLQIFDKNGKLVQTLTQVAGADATNATFAIPANLAGYKVVAFTQNQFGVSANAPIAAALVQVPAPTVRAANGNAVVVGAPVAPAVNFAANSAALTKAAAASIQAAAAYVKANGGKLVITGFTSLSNVSATVSQKIATQRALAVAVALRKLGVNVWMNYSGAGAFNNKIASPASRKAVISWVPVP